jgi:lysophospholipase L1-like esterase
MADRSGNGFWRGLLVCAAWALAWSPLRAGPVAVATLGDSITDTYAGKPYAGGNLSWTDQLRALRGASLTVHELALAGSTSTDLLNQGQPTSAVNLARHGKARYATLIIGANDIGAFILNINPKGPATLNATPYVQRLVANIASAVNALQSGGVAGVVLATLPDVGQTPRSQAVFPPVFQRFLTAVTQAVNAEILALAGARHLPVVDLYALNNLSRGPVMLGGVNVQPYLYSVDGFHPSTIGSALIANAELEALRRAYHADVTPLSAVEILNEAGLTARDPSANFDVAPYVLDAKAPEPSGLLLLATGALGLVGWRHGRRLRRSACGLLALLLTTPALFAQGALQRVRTGPPPHPTAAPAPAPPAPNKDNSAVSHGPIDGEGLGALAAGGLLTVTSPIWVPMVLLDDNPWRQGHFRAYPYAGGEDGFLVPDPGGWGCPDDLNAWSFRASVEDGDDFRGLNRLGAVFAVDTSWRLGAETRWDWYRESLTGGGHDEAWLGVTELTWRFAQKDWIAMQAGVGVRSWTDRVIDRWGANFHYGADLWPIRPLTMSLSVDLGNLGRDFVVETRGLAGVTYRGWEAFVGYDFRRVGEVNLQGPFAGLRVWF